VSNLLILGSQWGDEGKGKIVDLLAEKADLVIRFQGGANAGHTVVAGDEKFVLHQLPSGVLSGGCFNVIGNGCVVDPNALMEEITAIRKSGIIVSPRNLLVSANAHVVTRLHKLIDEKLGGTIGTTGRGIGPCYSQKAERIGLRFHDLLDGSYKTKIRKQTPKLDFLSLRDRGTVMKESIEEIEELLDILKPYIGDTQQVISRAVSGKKNVLFEGAQGTMLDVDHGTYPFVTSSNTTIGAAFTGTGVFVEFNKRIAVAKAFQTRVGKGPFPTELKTALGNKLRTVGKEFGATTGRPRRCGWLDLKLLKDSFMINGFNYLILTKLDCLTGIEKIKVAIDHDESERPIYVELPGWTEDISDIGNFAKLPKSCRDYIAYIEEFLKIDAGVISVGPDRKQTLIRRKIW